MKNKITLSQREARQMALKAQGLLSPVTRKTKGKLLEVIQHLGYVQIDTLAVVNRAHHHTLWSRLPYYIENDLHQLLEKDKTIFEYWSHAASYLPMEDFRYSLPRKRLYAEGKSHWFSQDKKLKKYVLDKIRAEGPLQSKDFEHKRNTPGNWFDWKPTKKALEQLFMEGELMVSKRQGFQKVYDLTERVLPKGLDVSLPSEEEHVKHLIRKSLQSHGILEKKETVYFRKDIQGAVSEVVDALIESGELLEVRIEGRGETRFITSEFHVNGPKKKEAKESLHLLSPFDNAVIQRKRMKGLFGFDYTIECYVPEAKREFGYFCLPVLYGNSFVARLDPKADRAAKIFYVKSMHFEDGFFPDESFNLMFVEKLKAFAAFNGCERILIDKAQEKWKKEIKRLL